MDHAYHEAINYVDACILAGITPDTGTVLDIFFMHGIDIDALYEERMKHING